MDIKVVPSRTIHYPSTLANGATCGRPSWPWIGSGILIVEFQAYIVFAIYRMIFEAYIAQISLRSANIAIYRDICLKKLRQISIFHIAISFQEPI